MLFYGNLNMLILMLVLLLLWLHPVVPLLRLACDKKRLSVLLLVAAVVTTRSEVRQRMCS